MTITRPARTALALSAAVLAAGAALPSVAAAADGGRPYRIALTAEAEVPPFVGVEGTSGSAVLRVNAGQGRLCVEQSVEGFTPVLSHVHEAPAGANGPVVIDLTAVLDGGCVTVDRALLQDLLREPEEYYVNVHAGLPGTPGFFQSVRGQLAG